jgi:hypothetical protein
MVAAALLAAVFCKEKLERYLIFYSNIVQESFFSL